jgi:predicted lipoprotein with Yx(FWY)xxD motif
MKKSSIIIWIIVIIIVIVGIVYFAGGQNSSYVSTPTPAASTAVNPTSAIATTSTVSMQPIATSTLTTTETANFGTILMSTTSMTLYTYSQDTVGKSNCAGNCIGNWPPYTVAAGTVLTKGTGVTGTIATITRTDGTLQVTYNGKPLYFFIKDLKPGNVNGNNVNNFSAAKP